MAGKHQEGRNEPIVEPDLAIIDSHHHLFVRPGIHYLFDEYLADTALGHNIKASVYVETRYNARTDEPEMLQPLGKIAFANGAAELSAAGLSGPCRMAGAIIGHADLTFGDQIGELLDRTLAAA